jgi:hypothetical protein
MRLIPPSHIKPAIWDIFTPFCCSIYGIFRIVSEKQMSWIDTLRIIARMANLNAPRDFTINHFPANYMCPFDFSRAYSYAPVSIFPAITTNPKPAILSFVDELPESFLHWSCFESGSHRAIAFVTTVFSSGMVGRGEYALAL